MRRGFRVLKVEEREVISKTDFSAPATAGEQAVDTAKQVADREAVARQHFVERELAVKYYQLHSFGLARDRQRQLQLSAEIDALEYELHFLREKLGTTGNRRDAGSEQVAKSDPIGFGTNKRRDTLGIVLRQPSLKKADLPNPFELDNSLGLRDQKPIK